MALKERLERYPFALQAYEAWGRMPKSRRIIAAGTVAIVAGLLGWVIVSGSSVDYRPFANDLSTEEAAAVRDVLEKSGIPYRLDDNGVLMVPTDSLHRAKLDVSQARLPSGGSLGYELLDEQGPVVDRDTRQLNRRRALEGELARTIRTLDEVKAARVHLGIPKPTVFKKEQREPTASVAIRLEIGRTLDAKQVEGIQLVVASAVEGLKANKVTVVDSTGKPIGRPKGDSGFDVPTTQLELTRQYETAIESNIVGMLEPVAGFGRVIARASIDLDFSSRVETIEEFDPERPAVRSERRTTETRGRTQPRAAGRVGAAAATGAPQETPTATENSQRQDEAVNYELNKTLRQENLPPGRLRRVSISVLLHGRTKRGTVPEGGEGPAPTVYEPFSEAELKDFEKIVKGAVGFDESRGDRVEIMNMPFAGVEEEMMLQEPLLPPEIMKRMLDWGFVLILLGALYFAVVRPIMRSAKRKEELEEAAAAAAAAEAAAEAAALAAGESAAELPEGEAPRLLAEAADSPDTVTVSARGEALAATGEDDSPVSREAKEAATSELEASLQEAAGALPGVNHSPDAVPAKLAIKLRERAVELSRADAKRAAQVIRSWLKTEKQHASS